MAKIFFINNQFEILDRKDFSTSLCIKQKKCKPRKIENSIFFNPETITTLTDEEKTSYEGFVKVVPYQAHSSSSGIALFARAFKNKSSVKGIEVNNHGIKIAQYADDTTVFVGDGESVLELLNFLEEVSSLSGLEINASKTEAMEKQPRHPLWF